MLNRWSSDVSVSKLPAAKADGKINVEARPEGRQQPQRIRDDSKMLTFVASS